MKNQKGISLLEILFGMVVLTFVVASMMKALDQSMKGQTRVRNDLRAATLAKSKLDSMKDYAHRVAASGAFNTMTSSPQTLAFAATQTALVEGKAFTWAVLTSYVSLQTVSAPAAVAATVTTKTVKLYAAITWSEGSIPRFLTQTTLVSDPNQ